MTAFDGFVCKLNSSGTALLYSTYLGGGDLDFSLAIAIDSAGNAYVTGQTSSAAFPVTPGAYETQYRPVPRPPFGSAEPFVTKINPSGSGLVYSTYVSATKTLAATDIALDAMGNSYFSSGQFLAKLDATGSSLLGNTFLGGVRQVSDNPANIDDTGTAVELDRFGKVHVAGISYLKFPTRSPSSGIITDPGIATTFLAQLSVGNTVRQVVPVVVSTAGLNGSFFTTELTLTNRGTNAADLQMTYTAAFGGGNGSGSDRIPAGQQRIVPDAIAYLRSLGIPIPASGDQGGTLSIDVTGDVFVLARTATRVGEGRAGLAYPAFPALLGLTDPAFRCGLRQDETDRANVAIENGGSPGDGDITVRVSVYSGAAGDGAPARVLEQRTGTR